MAFVHKIRQVQLVGPKIRQIRKERKLTQTELASRIGIQQSDLSRMEKGEYRISLDTLFKILAEFDLSIGEFFDDLSRESVSPRDLQLLKGLRELPSQKREEIEDLVERNRVEQAEESALKEGSNNR